MYTVLGNLRHNYNFKMMRGATIRFFLKLIQEPEENSINLQKKLVQHEDRSPSMELTTTMLAMTQSSR